MRKILALCTSALLGLGLAVGGATTASADSHHTDNDGRVCAELDSGKIMPEGEPDTVLVTAPEGQLIDGYCVKTGSEESGDGPIWVEVDPPATEVLIDYPEKDSISHYSLSYVDAVTNPVVDAELKCPVDGIKVFLSNEGEGVNTAVEFEVYLDDVLTETVTVEAGDTEWVLLDGLTEDQSYHIEVVVGDAEIFDEVIVFNCETDLPTLPDTGADVNAAGLLAGGMLLLGVAGLYMRRRAGVMADAE